MNILKNYTNLRNEIARGRKSLRAIKQSRMITGLQDFQGLLHGCIHRKIIAVEGIFAQF